MFEELADEKDEDWYASSDTSADIPNPDMNKDPLYQDEDSLPEPLKKSHFEEGLLYTLTLLSKQYNPMLVQIIELEQDKFVYQTFFHAASKAMT